MIQADSAAALAIPGLNWRLALSSQREHLRSMSQILQLVAANPGWVSIFETNTGQRTYRPIAAFALTLNENGENYLQPYSGDSFTDNLHEGFAGYEYSPHIVQELARASGR